MRSQFVLIAALSAACSQPAPPVTPLPSPTAPQTVSTTADLLSQRVDSVFARWDSAGTPGAAVMVLKNREVAHARGYGMATLEYNVPITPATVFHVASVSKQFTAFGIAMLADQGRLSLDEDIRVYLPELPDFGRRITVRQLIHHTSGLRDQWDLLMLAGWRLDDVITRDQILSLVKQQRELNFEPGAEHVYSNTGYTLLAEIIARVTGEPFPEWMRTHVFQPLGMRSTHFHDDHEHVVPNRAYSYAPAEGGGGYRNAVLSYANVGATSLFTTAEDLAKWLLNFQTQQVGGGRVLERMGERAVLNSGDSLGYAYALVHGEFRGVPMIQHTGADAGFRSIVARFPEQRLDVVVLSNISTFNLGAALRQIAEIYLADHLGPTPEPAAPQPRPESRPYTPVRPSEYTGRYSSTELGVTYQVARSADDLVLRHPRHGELRLVPTAADTFHLSFPRLPAGYFRVAFQREPTGRINGFHMVSNRTRNLRFTKEK